MYLRYAVLRFSLVRLYTKLPMSVSATSMTHTDALIVPSAASPEREASRYAASLYIEMISLLVLFGLM